MEPCIFPRNRRHDDAKENKARIPRGRRIVIGTNGDTSFINQCRGAIAGCRLIDRNILVRNLPDDLKRTGEIT